MYQVYSVQQPGRPRWTLGACAILLLATVALAAALVRQHARAGRIDLSEVRHFPQAALQARIPAAWTEQTPDDRPPGFVARFVEPASPTGSARQLFLFRGPPSPTGLPDEYGVNVLAWMARRLARGEELALRLLGHEPVGGLPGATLGRWSANASDPSGRVTCCLGRVGMGAGGRICGLLLVIPDRSTPRQADIEAVDQIAQHLELTDAPALTEGQALMAGAGIRFDPPADVRFAPNDDPVLPRVRLFTTRSQASWFLDLYRVPLVEPRTPSQLVQDCAHTLLRQAEPPPRGDNERIGQREAVFLAASNRGRWEPSLILACARTDENTVLMMIGRHAPEAGPALRTVCRSILSTAEVRGSGDLVDIPSAKRTAREWLDQITEPGALDKAWNSPAWRRRAYAWRSPAILLGHQVCRSTREPGDDSWTLTSDTKLDLPDLAAWESRKVWRVRDGAAGFEMLGDERVPGRSEVRYFALGDARTGRVERQLTVSRESRPDERREATVTVDEVFACEPVLELAGARIALDPQRRPAIFTGLEAFPEHPVCHIMSPMGQRPLPGGSTRMAWTVRLISDYYPAPVLLYYDDAGILVAVSFDQVKWQELTQVDNTGKEASS